jgi:cell wall-associated NlpC family hydrolase
MAPVRALVPLLLALAFAAPADASLKPGDVASIDVSVATLWKAPNIYRSIDRPAIAAPVNADTWNVNMATADDRRWLVGRVQTQALYGQLVTVRAVQGSWAKIAVHDEPDPQDRLGYPGWVPLRQLKPAYDTSGAYLVVRKHKATLRAGGKTVRLSYGTRLPVIAGNRVRTPDGEGVVTGASPPLRATNASIIAEGKRFLGLRYIWGGLSSWGFDCSGLIWDLYRAHGLTIPRDADPQMHHGTPVSRDTLRAGDLLFFGRPGYASHVSIYLGNGMQLEAPDSAHAVRVSPVRWGGYIGARRYLNR